MHLTTEQQITLSDYLASYREAGRLARMEAVLAERTRWITVALEDIYQPHNAAAVLRSCDGFGVQQVHVIEANKRFRPSDQVALGAEKWVDVRRWKQPEECIKQLKEAGFRVCAGSLRDDAVPLDKVPLERPLALLVGHERTGLSETAHELADVWFTLPMRGFTESYNLSVFSALCLFELTRRLRTMGVEWHLSEAERIDIKLRWLLKDTRAAHELAQRFCEERGWTL